MYTRTHAQHTAAHQAIHDTYAFTYRHRLHTHMHHIIVLHPAPSAPHFHAPHAERSENALLFICGTCKHGKEAAERYCTREHSKLPFHKLLQYKSC